MAAVGREVQGDEPDSDQGRIGDLIANKRLKLDEQNVFEAGLPVGGALRGVNSWRMDGRLPERPMRAGTTR